MEGEPICRPLQRTTDAEISKPYYLSHAEPWTKTPFHLSKGGSRLSTCTLSERSADERLKVSKELKWKIIFIYLRIPWFSMKFIVLSKRFAVQENLGILLSCSPLTAVYTFGNGTRFHFRTCISSALIWFMAILGAYSERSKGRVKLWKWRSTAWPFITFNTPNHFRETLDRSSLYGQWEIARFDSFIISISINHNHHNDLYLSLY